LARKNNNKRDRKTLAGSLRQRKKYCYFCKENIDTIDYKNIGLLERYISDKGKIRPSRSSGNCVQHQRMVASAIKRGRVLALIPYYKR
jgi:small subunit ribosomal protein S18